MKSMMYGIPVILLLFGCTPGGSESEPMLGRSAEDTTPQDAPGHSMAEGESPPEDTAVLPDRFADMDPDHAARRGPDGIGEAREVFHELLGRHEAIDRQVTDLPNGVSTVTTSDDPEVAALIRLHVRQMVARFERGMPVRRWDPLFAELIKHYESISIEIEEVPGGLRVVETSDDPQAVLLIRQHAHRGVSEFVERGFDRASEPSPLPEGYEP